MLWPLFSESLEYVSRRRSSPGATLENTRDFVSIFDIEKTLTDQQEENSMDKPQRGIAFPLLVDRLQNAIGANDKE